MPLAFSQTILCGADYLHTAPSPSHHRPPCPLGLAIGALNIQDFRGFVLAQAIRAVEYGGFDVMLLKEKITQTDSYYHNVIGYKINCSMALPSSSVGAQDGVGLVMRERTGGWGIESMSFHGPNVVSCDIFTGHTRILIVGA